MTVYLIRHGKTPANEQHLYCGATDLPLSAEGIAQLKTLRQRYPCTDNCRYVTSGMRRTEQTLSILFGDVPHRQVPRLREMDFGAFEMQGYAELKDTPAYQAWLSGDNEANPTPGGESGREMAARAVDAFSQLAASGDDTVIVTHGGVIAAIMAELFPGEGKNRYQWQPQPGLGYRLDRDGSGWTYIPL